MPRKDQTCAASCVPITKVDVHDFSRRLVDHQIRRVPVAKPEQVSNHAHDSERTRVGGPPSEPLLPVRLRLLVHDPGKVHATRLLHDALKYFELLQREEFGIRIFFARCRRG